MPTKDELRAEIAALKDELSKSYNNIGELELIIADLQEEVRNLESDLDIQLDKVDELGKEYEQVLAQVRWTHTMLALLLEEQGGLVSVQRSVAETYDGNLKKISMYDNEKDGVVLIEVTECEPVEGEIVD